MLKRLVSPCYRVPRMGVAAALLVRRDPYALFIDDPKDVDPRLKGYARSIFRKMEWPTLKMFCNTFGITHADTCVVFKRFLQYEEVYLLQFKVRTKDVKNHFSLHTKLEQEIADSLVPLMFMKEFPGLEPPQPNGEVVSFARFIITSYLFCTAQIPDLMLDFIAMLRRKLAINVQTKLHSYSFDQLMKVMVEDLQPSAASHILARSLGEQKNDKELPLLTIVKLGIKYPILFYVVERFRKHVKRLVFGDKFWAARTYTKSRISELEGNASHFGERFKDEKTALVESSRSIIADVVTPQKRRTVYEISDREVANVLFLDEEGLLRLKDMFGYERSRQLVVDSEVGLDCESKFVENAFGSEGPVARPLRGVQVFPGGLPVEILEVRSEDGAEGEDEEECGDGELLRECVEDDDGGEDDADDERPGTSSAAETKAGANSGVERRSRSDLVSREAGSASSPSPSWHMFRSQLSSSREDTQRMHSDERLQSPDSLPLPLPLPSHCPQCVQSRVETVLDAQQGREFRFDPETGKSAWVYCAVDADGDVILETCF